MQRLSNTTMAVTAVQNPSVSELHVVKEGQSKKGPETEERSLCHSVQSKCKFIWGFGEALSHSKKDCPAECYKCGRKGHFRSNCKSKQGEKDMGKMKDIRKLKSAKVHELSA